MQLPRCIIPGLICALFLFLDGIGQTTDTAKISILVRKGDSIACVDKWKAHDLYFQAHDKIKTIIEKEKSPGPALLLLATRCDLACGSISYRLNNYANAQQFYLHALKLLDEIKDKKFATDLARAKAQAILGFSSIQLYQENLDGALKYAGQAREIYDEIVDSTGIANTLVVFGHIYHSGYFNGWKSMEKGIDAMKQAVDFAGKGHNDRLIIHAIINIGAMYHDVGNFSLAEKYYTISIAHLEKLNALDTSDIRNYSDLAGACTSMGNLFRDQRMPEKAIVWQTKGLEYATRSGNKKAIIFSAENLAAVEYSLSKYKEAYENLSRAKKNSDDIYNESSSRQLKEMDAQYQAKVQQEEIEHQGLHLKQERFVRWALLAGIAALIIIIIMLYRHYRLKRSDSRIIAAEKKRSDELLLNILPHEVADEFRADGTTRAKMHNMVTVLFADFKELTSIAEKLTPLELVNELKFCIGEFDKIISKYPIEKIKTTGESYMCAGGLPVANETHGTDIVRAALEMISFIKAHQTENSKNDKPSFGVRIGIHTGPVIAGVVGLKKFTYDIWGDTVNTAFRMETCSNPGRINISHSTYQFVKDQFYCKYRGKIEVKNRSYIDMYFVEGIKSHNNLQ